VLLKVGGDKYSSPTSLSSSNPFWVLPYPHALTLQLVYDLDLRDEDLKIHTLQDSICFEFLKFPKKIINLAWYVGFPILFSTHTYCGKYLNT
jgi:hypothetical protein